VTDPGKIAQYDGVVAAEFDRLSRGDKQSTNAIEKWAHDHGKVILTIDGLKFPSEGMEGAIWDFKARQSHQEWLNTSKRYRRMIKHLKDNGYMTGRPCFGFKVVPKDNHKTMVPDPVNAEYVRQAASRYLAGSSLRVTCEWLKSEGVKPPSGSTWNPYTLSRIFRNESLIGRRRENCRQCRGKTGKTQCRKCGGSGFGRTYLMVEPIMDRGTWNKLQEKLNANAARAGIAPKQTAMLTSIAACSKCGGPMYRIKDRYYRCHGTELNPSTCKLLVSIAELDEYVSSLFAPHRFGKQKVYETVLIPGEGHTDAIAEVEQDLRELDFDSPDFADRQKSLLAERSRLKALPATPARTERRDTGRTLAQEWESLVTSDRRSWLLERDIRVIVRKPVTDSGILMHSTDGDLVELRPRQPETAS
jgi:hypothetical protein